MNHGKPQNLVLAMYPFKRGFAFVLFEGPESPFEWGVKRIVGDHKNDRSLAEIKTLIDRFRPEVLVIEDTNARQARRTPRIRKLYRMVIHLAQTEYVDLHRCSRPEVKACFAALGASTKYEIAKSIAAQIPAFAHRMPRPRAVWSDADSRQSLFDAAALGLAYFARGIPSPYATDIAA